MRYQHFQKPFLIRFHSLVSTLTISQADFDRYHQLCNHNILLAVVKNYANDFLPYTFSIMENTISFYKLKKYFIKNYIFSMKCFSIWLAYCSIFFTRSLKMIQKLHWQQKAIIKRNYISEGHQNQSKENGSFKLRQVAYN